MLPFRLIPRRPHPLIGALRALRDEVAHGVRHLHELKEQLMVTRQEIEQVKADLGEVKTILVEAHKDVNRVADKLDAALDAGDLSEVRAGVAELRTLAQGIGDRAEAADPEQAPTEPTPAEPEPGV